MRKKIFWVPLALALTALVVWGFVWGGWSMRGDKLVPPYSWRHQELGTFTEGDKTYQVPEDGLMAEEAGNGGGWATPTVRYPNPLPVQCTSQALHQATPAPGSWVIPTLPGPQGWATGSFTTQSFTTIPPAPQGALSPLSAPLGTAGKPSVLAGHVNNAYPSNQLSAWGQLHNISPCAHVYITDEVGVTREYQVIVIDTIKQEETATDKALWGSAEDTPEEWAKYNTEELVWLLTCSGAYIGDTGTAETGQNSYLFPYTKNLKIGLVPVSS